ncbi:phage tail tape measure protein [Streptomyces sp. NPDC020298]|uniref:phage tail tape measure protein n=1 Tax=unclassified Streptomyces TaxID=2593676 RepID=UPI00340163A5
MTNVVEILVTAKNLTGPAMASVNSQVNAAGSGMRAFHKTALIAGAGLATIGVESVKMAAKFDSSMTLLHTQAGVAQSKMAGLKQGVLDLAGKVGQDPDSLAESLFHVESNFESMGISSKKALSLVETAAKGATTGHADLVDVTNALTAAVASGIPGVQNFDKAMGVLNATVGVGDMKMQDLANAFGSGMVATVKGFGLNIQDVGAALAVFGDNNIRGSLAGNQLRMSVMALAHPVATAGDTLKRLGLTTETLGQDMQKGGLKLALEDLVGRMKKAGISSKEQGQIITEAFGRKAGAGLNVLVSQMDRLESKYPALAEGANKFGKSWEDTQKTFSFQMKALNEGFKALMITVGTKLIPPLQSVVGVMLAHKGATVALAGALAGLLTVTVAVSVAMKAVAATKLLWGGITKGVSALTGVFETVALKAMYMRQAFVTAGGGVRGLSAAFSTLSTGAKIGVAAGAIGALVLALHELSDNKPAVEVDALSTSLNTLATSGKVTGTLKTNFDEISASIAMMSKGASDNKFLKLTSDMGTWLGIANGPSVSDATKNLDAWDKVMAENVRSGHVKEAAAQYEILKKAWGAAPGAQMGRLSKFTDDYHNALADLGNEEKASADSMGLFGQAAASTQAQLDGEAQSAKGLEQSIMALNAVHRGAFDAETAFYQAMSDAQKAVKENGRTLNVNSEAGRKNRDVLSALAAKTEDLVDKKMKEKTSWDQVDKVYQKGRKTLIDTAMAMGDTKTQAEKLADEILKAPNAKKFQFKVDDKRATADLSAFNAAVKKSPGAKSVTLKTLSKTAEQVLAGFGFKVTHLKDGSVKVTAKTGGALGAIRNIAAAIAALHDKTVTFTANYRVTGSGAAQVAYSRAGGHQYANAHGGLVRRASGGPVTQHFDSGGYVQGPGTPTSDSIVASFASGATARISDSEYVVQAAAVRKYGVKMLDAINAGRVKLAGFARGGHLSKAQQRARAQSKAEAQARHDAMGDLTISHFGHYAGYQHSEFGSALSKPDSISSLVNSLNQWRSIIQKATHGATENRLLKQLDSTGKKLLSYEKSLGRVTASLDKAKDKLNSLKDAASQLSSSVKGNLISSANITKGASGEGTVTLSSIKAGMTVSRDKVTAFATALKQLKSKGFSRSIIQQVAEAGIDGGGLETAGALLQASASEVSTINATQAQIEKAAGSAGKTTADAVYEKAIKDQTRVVDKLTKQQHALQKSMDKLTKAMEKAIEKAFGKKAAGGIVGAAASGGIRGGLTLVGEQGPELAALPIGSRVYSNPDTRRMLAATAAPWASMLTTPRRAPAAAAGSVPVGQREPVVIELRSSGNEIDDFLLKILRRAIKTRGGNVQVVLSGRN